MTEQVFDMAALSAQHTSEDSARRVRKRHWAEFRLKAYGILAILVAATALVILMYTIVAKATSVTKEYYVNVDVQLDISERNMGPLTDGDPATSVDLNRMLRGALAEAADAQVRGRGARPLNALLSRYEGYELATFVELNPDAIGTRIVFESLLDDNVQLYFRGDFGTLTDAGSTGEISIEAGGASGTYEIVVPSNVLSGARIAMQRDRGEEARVLRQSANDQLRAYEETLEKLEDETDPEERDRLGAMITSFREASNRGFAAADEALREATDMRNTFTLRDDDPSVFIKVGGGWIKVTEMGRERLIGTAIDPVSVSGPVREGDWTALLMDTPESERQLNDQQVVWLENLNDDGRIVTEWNARVLFSSDSSNAELAGIWGALIGSFWTMIVTFTIVFPIGVMASIYLEEFAPKNRLTGFIEVNINNLAAVPSIVFGLLGLTILLSGVKLFGFDLFDGLLKAVMEDPRSTPLAGGVVLALMSLPTIIIAARASIKAVPPSIRDAALGLGASKLQTSTHHVLPLAMPGILTGSIIAMAQALGETAPLIIIGMNSFIQDPPTGPMDKANVLPSLIYLWNNNSERLFDGKTAVAISVLLIFLILMNALAVVLRKRFERRW